MVKPQFEVGREHVGAGGVVTDTQLRAGAVLAVARHASAAGWHPVAVAASPLPGPSGNVEYFLHLRSHSDRVLSGDALESAVARAVREGPQ
jgi:23S rRNA (cytidine1920-2'-O)/16S rRNA (cytidine1409-2'-O)-methyltransferase